MFARHGLSRSHSPALTQRKIEDARARRKADEQAKRVASAKQWKAATVGGGSSPPLRAPGAAAASASSAKKSQAAAAAAAAAAVPRAPAAAAGAGAGASLQYGRFEGVEARGGRREKKAKKDRVAALAVVEARQTEVEAAGGAASAEGQALMQRQSWGAALARASGEKVLDDPKLLKKSIKRAQQLKMQRGAAWSERLAKQGERADERQSKRRENLQQRTDQKVAKKIERRENKLLRPGFEGRKGGEFLNK